MELILLVIVLAALALAGGWGTAKATEYPLQQHTAEENRTGRNNLLIGLFLAVAAAVAIAAIGGAL